MCSLDNLLRSTFDSCAAVRCTVQSFMQQANKVIDVISAIVNQGTEGLDKQLHGINEVLKMALDTAGAYRADLLKLIAGIHAMVKDASDKAEREDIREHEQRQRQLDRQLQQLRQRRQRRQSV